MTSADGPAAEPTASVVTAPLAGGHLSYLLRQVTDLPAVTAFYRTLGFEPRYDVEGVCVFLRLPGDPGPMLALYAAGTEPSSAPSGLLIVDVPDLDRALAALRASGLSVGPIEDVPHGRAVLLHDPEGHLIELHQPTS